MPKGDKGAAALAAKKIEDKTFGMKNKNKSKKVQQQVAQIKKSCGVDQPKVISAEMKKKAADDAINSVLFVEAVSKKDLAKRALEKAAAKMAKEKAKEPEKRDIYTDSRDTKKEEDDMAGWDEEKLKSVVESKKKGQRVQTDIICKHFIDAVEKRQYGWFWECPNGGDKCQYRHALPPDFVLKRDRDANAAVVDTGPTLEETLEEKRKALTERTPVTFERLQAWLAAKVARQKAAAEAELEAARKQYAKGKSAGVTGRMLFTIDSSIFVDDAGASADAYERDESDDERDPEDQGGEALNSISEHEVKPPPPAAAASSSAPPQAPTEAWAGGAAGAGGAPACAECGKDGAYAQNYESKPPAAGEGKAAEGKLAANAAPAVLTDLEGVDESLFMDDELLDDDELEGM